MRGASAAANVDVRHTEALLKTGALQSAIFRETSAPSGCWATPPPKERIRAGCDGYIAKPMRYRDFLAAIEARLART